MIILGSNGVLQAKYRTVGESDVLLLDISNDSEYLWTTSFDPTPLTTSSFSFPSESKNSLVVKIGFSVGLIVFFITISIVFLFYMRYRKNAKVIPTPGDHVYKL
jgi:hypothetical protein